MRERKKKNKLTPFFSLPPSSSNPPPKKQIPYEKGYCFIKYLESLVDGEKKSGQTEGEGGESESEFARWVAENYVAPRVGASATSEDFKQAFLSAFGDREAVASKIDWDAWLHGPGMPPVAVAAPSELGDAAEALARRWSEAADAGTGGPPPGASAADVAGWPAQQVTFFLEALSEARAAAGRPLPAASAAALGELYNLDGSSSKEEGAAAAAATAGAGVVGGCEVLCEYLCLALAAGHAPAVPAAGALLQKVGRMKFSRPLFRALAAADAGAAGDAFEKARAGLHPICAKMVASDLGLAEH